MYRLDSYPEFSATIDELCEPNRQPLTYEQYVALTRRALKLKERHPILRAVIANDMTCAGAGLEARYVHDLNHPAKILWDIFAYLEVPDARAVSREAAERGDFSEVDQKWQRIEDLVGNDQHGSA